MNANIAIVIVPAILLASCTTTMPVQEMEATNDVPTAVLFTETALTPELVVTEQPTATESPTQVPSSTPLSCVTLLTPPSGAEIPAIGQVTFSWSPMKEATFYVLTILPPSGEPVMFDAKQTFREQYMEPFSAGGQYQWKVIVQDRKRNEICSSEVATFSKPAYTLPTQTKNDDSKKKK